MINRKATWVVTILVISGCATYGGAKLEQLYGTSAPRDRVVETVGLDEVDYWTDVKPVIEQRCVVCHACYDADCQLKMSSIEGIERGASAAIVYNQSRLKMAAPMRLFEDAQTVPESRTMGFHPVLNEHGDSIEANREAGVMHQILKLKEQNPLPESKLLPDSFDLSLSRKSGWAGQGFMVNPQRDLVAVFVSYKKLDESEIRLGRTLFAVLESVYGDGSVGNPTFAREPDTSDP